MTNSQTSKLVTLDGRTGEGGGQIIRVAVALAAITGTPLQINNVRGNRAGPRGGGLKAQHLSCISTLSSLTSTLTNCSVGSESFLFTPVLNSTQVLSINRNIKISSDSAGSVLLIFQSLLPFLLFTGRKKKGEIVEVIIEGGTNVSFSLSYEYADQVLFPTLEEKFGIVVERKLVMRGWSHGTRQIGEIKLNVMTLGLGDSLKTFPWPQEQGKVEKIDVSIIVPRNVLGVLKKTLLFELGLVFPDVEINFVVEEDSRHQARLYTLLVAHTSNGLRFGRDWLYDKKVKDKAPDELSTDIAQKVVDDLDTEIRRGGLVDEYLQDQLVVFQALAEGRSSIVGSKEGLASEKERVDRMEQPFGDGSLHTTTARWVVGQLLPGVKWRDGGRVCEGVGWKVANPDRD